MHLRIHTVRSRVISVTFGDKHSYRIFLSYLARNKNPACKESCIFTFRTALRFVLTRSTPVTYRGKRVTKHPWFKVQPQENAAYKEQGECE